MSENKTDEELGDELSKKYDYYGHCQYPYCSGFSDACDFKNKEIELLKSELKREREAVDLCIKLAKIGRRIRGEDYFNINETQKQRTIEL